MRVRASDTPKCNYSPIRKHGKVQIFVFFRSRGGEVWCLAPGRYSLGRVPLWHPPNSLSPQRIPAFTGAIPPAPPRFSSSLSYPFISLLGKLGLAFPGASLQLNYEAKPYLFYKFEIVKLLLSFLGIYNRTTSKVVGAFIFIFWGK